MPKKIKIAVLSGGPSQEHEVSLKSAECVIQNLDNTKFEIIHIKISKEGIWVDQVSKVELEGVSAIEYLKNKSIDLVFIVMHGEFGEDGEVQKLLEAAGIKYTGSNSKASANAIDKVISSKILGCSGLNVPPFVWTNKEDYLNDREKFLKTILETFSLPVVIKPTDRGSSVGIAIVRTKNALEKAILEAFKFSNNVMAQNFVKGRELTCAVIESKNDELIPLVPTEILPNKNYEFFDYEAKYKSGATIEITPPNLSEKIINKVQEEAIKAHKALGCSHLSRTDFILDKNNTLYTLEVNTIPGMTSTSLIPQGARAKGISFPVLLEMIIESALR